MEEFFGIDFGTTNSAVVGRRYSRDVTLYGDTEGQPFPSLVAVSEATGQVQALGREVWNRREELSKSCRILSSAKLKLGKEESWRIGPELWTPERVVTEVLKGLRERVLAHDSGVDLSNPVIAIPVGFPPERRKALRGAAMAAGITIQGFVYEPTAAVLRNYEAVRCWPIVVVFDWGGGTLDISVVSIRRDLIQEIATAARELGGDELDMIIAEWAHMEILKSRGKDNPPFEGMDSRDRDKIISESEKAKRMLSDDDIVEISITKYGDFGPVSIILTYEEFLSLMQPKILEAIEAIEEAVIHKAKRSFDQIGCILMVGGSSKLRGLRDAMDAHRSLSKIKIESPSDSDWHIADGASILASNFGDYVCAQNVGVRLCDDTYYPLLKAGDTIHYGEEVTTFGLIEDTDNARFVFTEGHSDGSARMCPTDRTLGRLSVPAYGFTNEPIKLKTQVDEDLLLRVSAQSESRGESHQRTWVYPELRFSYRLPIEP